MSKEIPFVMQHARTGLFLGKSDKNPYKYGGGVADIIGAAGGYRWVRNSDDAIVFRTERDGEMAWIFMNEPPVNFIDVKGEA